MYVQKRRERREGVDGGATLISQYSYCGIHRRGQRTVAQLSSSLSLSLSLSHLLHHVTFAKATQWKAARSECDKATGLVATFCLPAFVSLLPPPSSHKERQQHAFTHSQIQSFIRFTHIYSIVRFLHYHNEEFLLLGTFPNSCTFPCPFSPFLSHCLCLLCWPLLQLQLRLRLLLLPPLLLFCSSHVCLD